MSARETPAGLEFNVWVQPRASKNEVAGPQGDALRVRLTAPPVDGAANQALIDFLAAALRVRRADVDIVAGHTGRHKRVRVRGGTLAQWERLVGQDRG